MPRGNQVLLKNHLPVRCTSGTSQEQPDNTPPTAEKVMSRVASSGLGPGRKLKGESVDFQRTSIP